MRYRLTYAFKTEEVYTLERVIDLGSDFLSAYEDAINYIEGEHGPEKTIELLGISILKIEEESKNEH